MKNVTTTAQLAAAKLAAKRQKHVLTGTKGMLVGERPATIADLTEGQINAAVAAVGFSVKATHFQNRVGLIEDLIGDALADMADGKFTWDSSKGSFYFALRMHTKTLLKKATRLERYKNEQNSYTNTANQDGENVEMPYATQEKPADRVMDEKNALRLFIQSLDAKGQQYIALFLQDLEDEQIAEEMALSYDTFRVWKTRFINKYPQYDLKTALRKGKKDRDSQADWSNE